MKIAFIVMLCMVIDNCFSQADTTQYMLSLQARYGKTIAHTVAASNIKGARPYGIELQIAKQSKEFNSWNRTGAFITSGLSFAYTNFDLPILGKGAMLNYFVQPEYRLSNRFSTYYLAGIGLDYLSNPSDVNKNPTNRTYSQHINPYMQAGIGFNYRLSNHFFLTANGVFNHTSNGEFRKPNTGINWTSVDLDLLTQLTTVDYLNTGEIAICHTLAAG